MKVIMFIKWVDYFKFLFEIFHIENLKKKKNSVKWNFLLMVLACVENKQKAVRLLPMQDTHSSY